MIESSDTSAVPAESRRILFVNHGRARCGVYEFGRNIHSIIRHSSKFDFRYTECSGLSDLHAAIATHRPAAVIYNYMPETMPWLLAGGIGLRLNRTWSVDVPQIGILHSVLQEVSDAAVQGKRVLITGLFPELANAIFDYYIAPDPTLILMNHNVYKTGRPILPFTTPQREKSDPRLVVGSFGFTKDGYDSLISRVEKEFDDAIINLHIPKATFGDPDGIRAKADADRCRDRVTKSGTTLNISHEYLPTDEVLEFLGGNDINLFCRGDEGRGISSVIDYALAVDRPIGVSPSRMFRHLLEANPTLNLDSNSISSIVERGVQPLAKLKQEWSKENLIWDYDRIISDVLSRERPIRFSRMARAREAAKSALSLAGFSRFKPYGTYNVWVADTNVLQPETALGTAQFEYEPVDEEMVTYNCVLNDPSRELYQSAVEHMTRVLPNLMSRKHPRANVQQAFIFDSVLRFARRFDEPRILSVGSFEDSAVAALRHAGLEVEEIDPIINFDLSDFCSRPSTELGVYDIVFSTSVIEHVPDDEAFLRLIDSLLSDQGVFFMTTDFLDGWVPGDPKPGVCERLYTTSDLTDRLPTYFSGLSLIGESAWAGSIADFKAGDFTYSFATFCGMRERPSRAADEPTGD